ncbi:energy transducer TonB [Stenotrophomonas pictorum JCM 9942]|jgi:protein TonB|uniref:Energy transducer TonB n=2 Tax=Stenotrophomonas pictorum TaxID=86184 RepID=A0A0R0A3X7_9GAMM|nr:energy transducer TonB [Stenotrophomonas pictorum]KRG39781.1 energy transducer TonB [Stenotrophomonas pictorum JCM 9942]
MSAHSSRSGQNVTFQLPRSSLKIAGIAFCAGLLLFFVVWLNARRNNDFYRAGPAQPQTEVAEPAPLPAPLPAGAGASDMPESRPEAAGEAPQLVETAPPPSPQPIVEAEPAPPPAQTAPAPVADTPTDRPVPLPDQSPAPTYPPAALRRGDSGTVVVQAVVDTRGVPLDVKIIQRSGSRDLDRAALDAVRNWRFQPAQSNGQPMQGTLEIPFDFKPAQ